MSDGSSKPEEYVRLAEENGLLEIGFTDHLLILEDGSTGPGSLKLDGLDAYIDSVRDASKASKVVSVKCGLEVDYIPGSVKRVEEVLESYRYSLDYTLMGVHMVGGFLFDSPESIPVWRSLSQTEVDRVHSRYYRLVLEGVETGLFDVIAHLDLVKKFGFRASVKLMSLLEPILVSVKSLRMAIEVSSAGLRHPAGEIYPSDDVLELAARLRIPAVMATDAHRVEDLVAGLDMVVGVIKGKGLPIAIPGDGLRLLDPLRVL